MQSTMFVEISGSNKQVNTNTNNSIKKSKFKNIIVKKQDNTLRVYYNLGYITRTTMRTFRAQGTV